MKFISLMFSTFFLFILLICQVSFSQNETFEMTQIGPDNLLNIPWDLQYGPDGYLWITEKHVGIVVRVNPENAERDELISLPDLSSTGGQDGLLGFAFHDEFESGNPYIYLSYTHMVSGNLKQQIVRYTYNITGNDGSLSSPMVLIDSLPSYKDHQSGRLVFGPDKKLYYTIGDQGVKDCATNLAQFLPTQEEIDQKDWSKYPGKVLRLNLDGSIPDDNPTIEGVKSHIYSYGHRNPQGLVFGSNGLLYSDEQGPSSDDEVNIIDSGKNYGWPFVAGVRDNLMYDSDGCLTTETSFSAPNYKDPLLSMFLVAATDPACTDPWMCRPNIAPSSIDIYESDSIPNWKNSLLITSLKKGRLYKVQLDDAGTSVVGEPEQLFYTTNRYRDIAIDPDGKSFYIITDVSGKTADASGMNIITTMENPGAILKFTYQKPLVNTTDLESETSFNLWPNPAKNTMFIEVEKDNNLVLNADLINSLGQVVRQFSELKNSKQEINIEGLASGIYTLKIKSENQYWQKRVVLY